MFARKSRVISIHIELPGRGIYLDYLQLEDVDSINYEAVRDLLQTITDEVMDLITIYHFISDFVALCAVLNCQFM